MSVFITGDRTNFISKGKIKKLKENLKKLEKPYNFDSIKYKDYLKEGNGFTVKSMKNDFYVELISEEIAKKLELKKKLRDKIRNNSHNSMGSVHKVLNQERKNVDKNIYKKYRAALSESKQMNIMQPSEVLQNPEKYKNMISLFSSDMIKVSKSSAIKNYYEALRQHLKIPKYTPPAPKAPEGLDFSVPDNIVKNKLSDDIDTEEEVEENQLNEDVDTEEENVITV